MCIQSSITKYVICYETVQSYISYSILLRVYNKYSWIIEKRYADFIQLYSSLKTTLKMMEGGEHVLQHKLNTFPPKLLYRNMNEKGLEQRRFQLEAWLNCVLEDNLCQSLVCVQDWLQVPDSVSIDRQQAQIHWNQRLYEQTESEQQRLDALVEKLKLKWSHVFPSPNQIMNQATMERMVELHSREYWVQYLLGMNHLRPFLNRNGTINLHFVMIVPPLNDNSNLIDDDNSSDSKSTSHSLTLFHSAIQIGPFVIQWNCDSLVSIQHYELMKNSIISSTRIASIPMHRANRTVEDNYDMHSLLNCICFYTLSAQYDSRHCNDHDFVNDCLSVLGIDLEDSIGSYKKSRLYQSLENTPYLYRYLVWLKHPLEYINLRKEEETNAGSTTMGDLTFPFEQHQDLDILVNTIVGNLYYKTEDTDHAEALKMFCDEFPLEYSILCAIDNAMWINHLSNDASTNSEPLCMYTDCICPFHYGRKGTNPMSVTSPLQHHVFTHNTTNIDYNQSHARILSLCGCGMRSYYILLMLKKLEQVTGRKTRDLFDLVVGSQLSSIIAVGIYLGTPIDDLIDMFVHFSDNIFMNKVSEDPLVSQKRLENVIAATILNGNVNAVLVDNGFKCQVALVSSRYDRCLHTSTCVFTSYPANSRHYCYTVKTNAPILSALRACCAIPGYFEPVIRGDTSYQSSDQFLDPSEIALCESNRLFPNRKVAMLTLGVKLSPSTDDEDTSKESERNSLHGLTLVDEQSNQTHQNVQHWLSLSPKKPIRYYRFAPDDASNGETSPDAIQLRTQVYLSREEEPFASMCESMFRHK